MKPVLLPRQSGSQMTGAEIMAVVGFFIMLSGAGWRVWARVEGRVKVAEDRADRVAERAEKVAADLAAHNLQAAETFATKAGMQEQTAQLLRAIEGVGNRIDGLHERLDKAFERTARTTKTARPCCGVALTQARCPNRWRAFFVF